MKIEKKHWIFIGVVIALIAIWYFFLRKKKPAENSYNADIVRKKIVLVLGDGMWGNESGYKVNRYTPTPTSKSSNPCARNDKGQIEYPCTYGGIEVNNQNELQKA
jgi:hypothetical protein